MSNILLIICIDISWWIGVFFLQFYRPIFPFWHPSMDQEMTIKPLIRISNKAYEIKLDASTLFWNTETGKLMHGKKRYHFFPWCMHARYKESYVCQINWSLIWLYWSHVLLPKSKPIIVSTLSYHSDLQVIFKILYYDWFRYWIHYILICVAKNNIFKFVWPQTNYQFGHFFFILSDLFLEFSKESQHVK